MTKIDDNVWFDDEHGGRYCIEHGDDDPVFIDFDQIGPKDILSVLYHMVGVRNGEEG